MGNKRKKHPAFLLWTPPQDNWVIVEEHFSLYRSLSVNEEGMIKNHCFIIDLGNDQTMLSSQETKALYDFWWGHTTLSMKYSLVFIF